MEICATGVITRHMLQVVQILMWIGEFAFVGRLRGEMVILNKEGPALSGIWVKHLKTGIRLLLAYSTDKACFRQVPGKPLHCLEPMWHRV